MNLNEEPGPNGSDIYVWSDVPISDVLKVGISHYHQLMVSNQLDLTGSLWFWGLR